MSSTQLQNKSFHVVERTKTSDKCTKMKKSRATLAKLLFLNVKYANLERSSCRRRPRSLKLSTINTGLPKNEIDAVWTVLLKKNVNHFSVRPK